MVDRLRLSGQRAKERKSESKRTILWNSLCKNISSVAFAMVVGRSLYTAGKILALALMGHILINFICFPRSFPSRHAERC